MTEILKTVALLCLNLSGPSHFDLQAECHEFYVHCIGSINGKYSQRLLYCISKKRRVEAQMDLTHSALEKIKKGMKK